MLYLVATPIGNLKDLSLRALEILNHCDTILCEDTRTSSVLLNHYQIKKKLVSFHKFNEASSIAQIGEDVKSGRNIALISDAGTPGISDPGERLVKFFAENSLPMTLIPGASAPLMALVLSGFSTTPFQFLGFLEKGAKAYEESLREILDYPHTSILFETPHHIATFFEVMESLAPDRMIAVARELTKKFETIKRGQASDLKKENYKGEIVIVIEGAKIPQADLQKTLKDAQELVHKGLSKKDAADFVTRNSGIKKRDIYQQLI